MPGRNIRHITSDEEKMEEERREDGRNEENNSLHSSISYDANSAFLESFHPYINGLNQMQTLEFRSQMISLLRNLLLSSREEPSISDVIEANSAFLGSVHPHMSGLNPSQNIQFMFQMTSLLRNLLLSSESEEVERMREVEDNITFHPRYSDFEEANPEFLASLLPHMTRLNPMQNLEFRSAMTSFLRNLILFLREEGSEENTFPTTLYADEPTGQFLDSLHPHMNRLNTMQNLQFRSEMISLVRNLLLLSREEEMNEEENALHPSVSNDRDASLQFLGSVQSLVNKLNPMQTIEFMFRMTSLLRNLLLPSGEEQIRGE